MKKILMILTSHKEIPGATDTGVWLGEFTDPYYEFSDAGFEITLASPKGGEPPVDKRSLLTENITSSNRRFKDDDQARTAFKNTVPLAQINADDFDALFFPGGHGPMWDLATDETNADLVIRFYEQQKPIGAVCHGPAGLIRAAERMPELLKGKRINSFTNTEEKAVLLYDHVPFKLEDRLKELGGDFHSATIPFTAHVETDGLLVTGQNPASASPAAQAIIQMLKPE